MLINSYISSPQIIYTTPSEFDSLTNYYRHARLRMNAFENSIPRAVMRGPNVSVEGLLWSLACAGEADQIEKDLDDADLFTI